MLEIEQSNIGSSPYVPLEIWIMILKAAGGPLVEDMMTRGISQFIHNGSVFHARHTSSELRRTRKSIVLTCRQWASIGLAIFYDHIHLSEEKQIGQLLNILKRPVMGGVSSDRYGDYVRGILQGSETTIRGTDLISLISLCPNVNWIQIESIKTSDQNEWTAVQQSISSLTRLKSFSLGPHWVYATWRDRTAWPKTQFNLQSTSFLAYDDCLADMNIKGWSLPRLRDLYLVVRDSSLVPRTNRLHEFLTEVGPQLTALSLHIYTSVPPSTSILRLCPNLKFLSCYGPKMLLGNGSHLEPLTPVHAHLETLSFASIYFGFTPKTDITELRPLLEHIDRQSFPSLKVIRFGKIFPVGEWGLVNACWHLPTWLYKVMKHWDDVGIDVQQADGVSIGLPVLSQQFLFTDAY
ncbi:hypothetical protein SISNIDRAFT_463470 [Sistotremastrum niveocremeum HHB9708]|uniref:F-box domain-containing protein n=1 Tax=Sistotremastrum niveocremeum HHB9708 TaxID=1314777 RepID=A0A164Y953_9AGAM|nr:hypothetical protein SISNIDRAFT_463470 [Sistotremastrum niveocremeum HHB9708]